MVHQLLWVGWISINKLKYKSQNWKSRSRILDGISIYNVPGQDTNWNRESLIKTEPTRSTRSRSHQCHRHHQSRTHQSQHRRTQCHRLLLHQTRRSRWSWQTLGTRRRTSGSSPRLPSTSGSRLPWHPEIIGLADHEKDEMYKLHSYTYDKKLFHLPKKHLVIPETDEDNVRLIDPDLQVSWVHIDCRRFKLVAKYQDLKSTFFLSFPLMWQSRLTPSKHIASRRPLPSILVTFRCWMILIVTTRKLVIVCVFLLLSVQDRYQFEPHLSVLLPILLEHELSLQPLVLVLPPPPVLSSLSLVLRHASKEGVFSCHSKITENHFLGSLSPF